VESVENSQTEFPTLSTGLGNPAKNQDAGFPHFHRADGEIYISFWKGIKKKPPRDRIPVDRPRKFKQDENVSVASLRS
jgi:hypothetical protein